jgi:hypothetical protein
MVEKEVPFRIKKGHKGPPCAPPFAPMTSAIGGGAPSYNHEHLGNESHYRCALLVVL